MYVTPSLDALAFNTVGVVGDNYSQSNIRVRRWILSFLVIRRRRNL